MSAYLIIICLFISLKIYCTDFCYVDYFNGSATVHHRITNDESNGYLPDLFNIILFKVAPVVPSLVALGKFIVNQIKNKKNNKMQNNVDKLCHKKQTNIKQILKRQRGQLQDLNTLYSHYYRQVTSPTYKRTLQQRSPEVKKLSRGKIRLTTNTHHWPYLDSCFAQEFNLLSNRSEIVKGVKLQHILGEEFYDITKKTEGLWRQYNENNYIKQLIKKSVACVKEGTAHNKSGEVVKASIFADIGWAILDHIQAIGEGIYKGTMKTINTFLHPIKIAKNDSGEIKQFVHSLGQATLEVIDFYMLSTKSPNVAQKKLQIWQENFSALLNTINQEWNITTNRDITKFVATFITERAVIHGVFNNLGKIFTIARINAAKFAQKKIIQLAIQAEKITLIKKTDHQKQAFESLQDMPQKSLKIIY